MEENMELKKRERMRRGIRDKEERYMEGGN